MKSLLTVFTLLVTISGIQNSAGAQEETARIAILPFQSKGIDSVYIQTAESILRTEVGKLSPMDIISPKRISDALGGSTCIETECALDLGKKLNATRVVGSQILPLGEKLIIDYFMVDVPSNRRILSDEITASSVEELDAVMKRVAKGIVSGAPYEKNAEVGNIVQGESNEPLRRASRKNFGVMFGYLYPTSGYDGSDRVFVGDARFDFELNDYAAGILLGIRKGFAMNLYGSYLASRTDVCPYIGGGFGFHWVSHDEVMSVGPTGNYTISPSNRSDGFELTVETGLRVLHTYNFQLMFNLEYTYAFNDYDDQAIVFTIGIL